jgi:putative ABC transport system ATP-binding protein
MKTLNVREGITFVIVSHDISITQVADRVIHLRDGKIIKETSSQPNAKKVNAE